MLTDEQKIFMYVVTCAIVFIFGVFWFWNRELLILAARNIIKNKRRSLILLCVIVSGLAGLMQFLGFGEYSLYMLREVTITSGLGHIQIYKQGYRSVAVTERMRYNISNYKEVLKILDQDPFLKQHVKSISGSVDLSGLVSTGEKTSIFAGKGIDTENYQLLNKGDFLKKGKELEDAVLPSCFTKDDFKDFPALLKRITNATAEDPLSLYLKEKLAPEIQKGIDEASFAKVLNELIQSQLIYDKPRFAGVAFSAETQDKLQMYLRVLEETEKIKTEIASLQKQEKEATDNKNDFLKKIERKQDKLRLQVGVLGKYDALQLNRFLLEDAYPKEIKKFGSSIVRDEQHNLNEFDGMFEGFPLPDEEISSDAKINQSIWKARHRDTKAVIEQPPSIDDVLVGEGLANALKVEAGDRLTVVIATKSGALNARDVNVRGIIQGFDTAYNDTILKMPLKFTWWLMRNEDVSAIAILLDKTENTDIVHKRILDIIKEKNLDLETSIWSEEAIMYKKVSNLFRSFFVAISFIIVLVVVFSIANAMMMTVMERTREIGTLRALGETKGGILQIFISESFCIGLMGGIVSIITGILISLFVNHIVGGIPMPPPPGGTRAYMALFSVIGHFEIWAVAFNLAVVSAFLSSIFPAKKAANMQIVDCIRYV